MAVKDIFSEGGRMPDPVSGNSNPPPREENLDELLAELDRQDLTEAKRVQLKLRITEMNTRIAESNARIRDLESGKVSTTTGATNKPQEDPAAKSQKDITANALVLMERGVSPDVVARYILAASTNQPGVVIPGGGAGGGFDMAGFASLVNTIKDLVKPSGDGGDPEMKLMVKTLAASMEALMKKDQDSKDTLLKDLLLEVKNIKTGQPPAPATLPKAALFEHNPTTGKFEKVELGPGDMYIMPIRPASTEKSVDQLREENRHAEEEAKSKLEEVKSAENRKLLGTVADSIVTVGSTIAASLVGGGTDKTKSSDVPKSEVTYFKCTNPKCNFDIPVSPGAWRIQCPNCATAYTDWSKAPPGTPRPGQAPPTEQSPTNSEVKSETLTANPASSGVPA